MRINVYKKNIYVVFSALAVLLLIGVSYAFFSYNRVGEKESQLITGDIYLHYTEDGDTLVLEDAFPETYEEATKRDDNYITFTIDGKNTTKNKDIYYEILLTNGSDISGKERFNPSDIMIELKETINGVTETVVDGMSYSDFNEKRIWVNTINKNTTEEIVITYQLRIWISEDVIISDTEDYADYTTEEFQNGYASVKVNVKGDFEYKEASTDPSCFAYQDATYYELNTSSEAVETCKDYFLNTIHSGADNSDAGDGYQSYCEGTGTIDGTTLNNYFYNFSVEIQEELVDIGVFEEIVVIEITNYDTDCGSDVVIPSRIDGKKVISIADSKSGTPDTQLSNKMSGTSLKKKLFNSKDYRVEKISGQSVFGNLEITSVKFPNTLLYIGGSAFSDNLITDIVIPKSVVSIGSFAFSNNPLMNVEFGGNPNIGENAFFSGYNEDVVKKLKYGGTCQEFTEYYHDSSMFGGGCGDDLSINPKEVSATDGICDIGIWFFRSCPA